MDVVMIWSVLIFLREILLPYGFLILLSFLYLKFTAINVFNRRHSSAKSNQTILILTAHPDDECMFFSPTILGLLGEGHRVHIACLSKGDFYGDGDVRQEELKASCKQLGVIERNITVIDDSDFPDNPGVKWSEQKLGEKIVSIVDKVYPNYIITFDGYGVSSHSNHRDVFRAVRKLKSKGTLAADIGVYTLESVGIYRKYLSWLDVPVSALTTYTVFVCSPRQVQQAWKAMAAHKSQLVWFRKLYILFSRYMLVNTLQELSPQSET